MTAVSQWDHEVNPNALGILTRWGTADDGRMGQALWQDCSDVLEHNKKRQTDGTNGYGKTREWRHIGEIPMIWWLKWKQEEGRDILRPENHEWLRAKLNDPDFRFLRTVPGRV